jgi:xanthine dehydrogenase YagT iron-sulfur-binding subunit
VKGSNQHDLSRRSFLQSSVLSTAGASMAEAASALIAPAEAAGSSLVGPDAVAVTLTVNGMARTIRAEPSATLASVLRGPLGLTGTKVACDRGACSACTVWVNGVALCSCMMLAIEVGPRRVTTIEGLASGDTLHPVQAAFIAHDAVQCGFCTPGMVMSCASLLERTPDPTEQQVLAAISGHVCRCGTYPHVVAATLDAARAARARKS